jgi:hypothetical protein
MLPAFPLDAPAVRVVGQVENTAPSLSPSVEHPELGPPALQRAVGDACGLGLGGDLRCRAPIATSGP